MRRLLFLLALVCLAALGPAQTIAQYLHLRKSLGITGPTDIASLDTIVGDRAIEVSGVVKGSFRVDDRGAIMMDKPDGGTLVIDCPTIPDWIVGSETKARLLLHISRPNEAAEVKAELLGAAPEGLVSSHDPKQQRTASAQASRRGTRLLASRSAPRLARSNWSLPKDQAVPFYASCIEKYNPRLTDDEAIGIAKGVINLSLQCTGLYKVDARLIMAMISVESRFNPAATSRHGAQGLGQLMPGTAQGLGVDNAYDTGQNLYGMVKLVASNLAKYRSAVGDEDQATRLAVAAYNAGNGAVAKYGGIPPYAETQNYVVKVMGTYYAFLGQN